VITPRSSSVLLLLLFASAAPRLGPPVGSEKDFEDSLALVERTIASGKGKQAKDLLLGLLESSKDKPWALYHFTEVEDDLRRSTFWSTHEKPDPKSLIAGELLSWAPSTGQIKLRYRIDAGILGKPGLPKAVTEDSRSAPRTLADFTRQGEAWIHPMSFDGPFTIEIKGSSYPGFSDPPHGPLIGVCAGWDQSTIVSFGLPTFIDGKTKRWLPARIVHVENGEATTEAQEETTILPGSSFDAKVIVSSSSVSAYLNDDKLLTAKRSGSFDGRFFFENFPGEVEIVVTGKAQGSWIQNVVDGEVQKRWSAFEASYKPTDDMPAWLRDKALGSSGPAASSETAIPGAEGAKDKERAAAFIDLMQSGKAKEALDFVGKIPAGEIGEAVRSWMTAFALNALGREREALAAYDQVCALDPKFLPARRMDVVLEQHLRGLRQAIQDGARVVADFPGESGPYLDLASLHLVAGHPEEAQAVVRGAIDAGVGAGALREAQQLVARALKGPLWTRSYEYKSEHYTVCSDIGQKVCFDAATLLEKFHTKFDLHLRHVQQKEKRIFRVFLFSGRAGYEAYTRDLTGREIKNTAGLYSSLVKQLLIWNLPDFEDTMRTVRHEGFHQYFDRLVADPPVWLNEGLAEYYEGSKLVKGAWSDGEIQAAHVETLSKRKLIPLKEFLHIRRSVFYDEKNMALSYAEAWAFVHFLLSSGPENRKLFDRFLDAMIAGTMPEDASAQEFTDAVISRLEPEFAAYVKRLR
jgi:hypothetical protein